MRAARPLFFALLPLLASCQLFDTRGDSNAGQVRLQGELSVSAGRLTLRPCGDERQLVLGDNGPTSLSRDAAALFSDGSGPLFVDVLGIPSDGHLKVTQLYRLQQQGHGCDDPEFKRLLLRASGNEPGWSVEIGRRGMLLQRQDQPSLVLPYVQEQLPDGRFDFSSEANGQRIQLWVTPQRCVDGMSGTLSHLSAELRIDGQLQRGCAYYGGQLGN
ncbi:COG3650 family protein [Zestomonas thermotolerans]|uniref:COG3650 family protein n=1 Tax=Zestomonas thermotolerans TaxID=157784 RepID=UPI000373BF25|nr:hypothetical protein [Pseudomonas thermotolerans]